jgi:diphthamide synthase (EF-2-diphthine--ammonia ligase)
MPALVAGIHVLKASRKRMKPKALISWSSGKDSAWALHVMRQAGEFDIVGALTTVNDAFGRVSVHGLRTDLLLAQVEAAELAPVLVQIPYPCTNAVYEAAMAKEIDAAKARGVTHIIFGDLFLQDIRAYREAKLNGTGITPVFPLWLRPTDRLAAEMIEGGVEAYLTTVDPKKVPAALAGRRFDRDLLRDLPPGVDACGENGEFHSFVAAGPMLSRPISVRVGDTVKREGFVYADLLPA